LEIAVLEVDRLNVAYGSVQVLWDVSMKVAAGEIVSVLGPNGAGKSTLLLTIIGMLRPMDGGAITYRNQRIDGKPPEETVRLGLALITEEKHLFLDMTVHDNLLMGSYIERAKAQRVESLQMVFDLFPKLAERRSQVVKTLSGGERQMVAIGRALMSRPDLLLIDEPSVGLTPLMTNRMLDAIQAVNRSGVTVLLVEQNIYLTLEMSHRAYVLENGRITLEGKGPELLHDSHIKKAYLAI
jgi:branched-chain amino acid transport system ATP-binding protein